LLPTLIHFEKFKIPLLVFTLFFSHLSWSQSIKKISGMVYNTKNECIPFATVQIKNIAIGTVADEYGFFELNLEKVPKTVALNISCLGYKTLDTIVNDTSSKFYFYLKPNNETLTTVFIKSKKLNAKQIVQKCAKQHQQQIKDYTFSGQYKRNISVTSSYSKMDLKTDYRKYLNKKTEQKLNKKLNEFSKSFTNNTHYSYKQTVGQCFFLKDSLKLVLNKKLYLHNDTIGFEDSMSRKMIATVEDFFEKDKTYNIKSGLFPLARKIKYRDFVNKDTLTGEIKSVRLSNDKTQSKEHKTDTEIEKEILSTTIKAAHLSEKKNPLLEVLNVKKYEYALDSVIRTQNNTVYKISFSPRKKTSKLKGVFYIDKKDYGLHKLEFHLLEDKNYHNYNFKLLLGIQHKEYKYKGVFQFVKKQGIYYPETISITGSSYSYLNRNLSFKENESDSFFKASKKMKIDLLIESDYSYQETILFYNQKQISPNQFNQVRETGNVKSKKITQQQL